MPILLALSLISTNAVLPNLAALAVSPPSDCTRLAANEVT